jgi:WD40 repeat protein
VGIPLVIFAAFQLTFAVITPALISGAVGDPITLWNTADGKLLGTIAENAQAISAIALHSAGRVLASVGDDRTLTLWDLQTRAVTFSTTPQRLPINGVAFSPDGMTIATGSDDRLVRLFKMSGNQALDRSELPEQVAPVEAVAFSPDGGILASAVAATIPLWDSKERQLIETLNGHAQTVISVAFSPDRHTFASVDEGGVIKLWDIGDLYRKENRRSPRATLIATLSSEIGATSIAFSPDARTLAGADYNGTVMFWDIDPQQVISRVCATLTDSAETAWLHSLPKDLPRTRICL